ncbi:MAG: putative Zn-dependent hydrolase, glyoxylase family [Clostridiaceae bacterium]|jgi:glyoxylase-like metal-dependent hydrolase (beta-lactamase superfamily II)|nr:putative Zn-dependent hydrolase, glyoxylase family [Clostridiaceae bacterium]
MELTKIKGNTYYIDAPTNCGVYSFKNKNCLLIDTNINNSTAKKLDEVLINNNLHPKFIINTHNHLDHCGGNLYFQESYPGCLVYASAKEKLCMENSEIFPSILFSASPAGQLKSNKVYNVDFELNYGTNKLSDEKFEIISLKGHSLDQIGIITPEKVCFLGDSIFSKEIISKYSLPYLYDISESINTLNHIKEIDADYFVLSHGSGILEQDEINDLVEFNLKNIDFYKNTILDLLDEPLSKEDILQNLVILNNLTMNFKQYHLNLSAVSAFISYYLNLNLINYSIEDGKLYYYKATKN